MDIFYESDMRYLLSHIGDEFNNEYPKKEIILAKKRVLSKLDSYDVNELMKIGFNDLRQFLSEELQLKEE